MAIRLCYEKSTLGTDSSYDATRAYYNRLYRPPLNERDINFDITVRATTDTIQYQRYNTSQCRSTRVLRDARAGSSVLSAYARATQCPVTGDDLGNSGGWRREIRTTEVGAAIILSLCYAMSGTDTGRYARYRRGISCDQASFGVLSRAVNNVPTIQAPVLALLISWPPFCSRHAFHETCYAVSVYSLSVLVGVVYGHSRAERVVS
eukprot:80772-Rhodomonas_salina.1